MLACPGFRDHTCFSHAKRQQGLAQRVVDFMSPRVVEILSLEPNLGTADRITEPAGVVQRVGSANEGPQKIAQFLLEFRILFCRFIFLSQLSNALVRVSGTKRPPKSPKRPLRSGTEAEAWEGGVLMDNRVGGADEGKAKTAASIL